MTQYLTVIVMGLLFFGLATAISIAAWRDVGRRGDDE